MTVYLKRAKKLYLPLMAVAGSLLLISLFGHMSFYIEALQFRVKVQLHETGYTEVEIPPLGTIRAHTHATPVKLNVRLENIDPQSLQQFLAEPPQREEIIDKGKSVLRRVAVIFIAKLTALALLGGLLGVLVTGTREPRKYITGLAAGFLLVCALFSGTYLTYDQGAFRNPQYSGMLRVAPWMVSMAQETLGKIETLGEQLEQVASGLNQLYARVDELHPLLTTEGEFKILHVSDLHNNPAGMDFILRVAKLFEADMIVDTGDISDFGSPLETLLLDRLHQLDIPYLFIPGNHDSPSIVEKMQSIPRVTVVNGLLEINGLVFYGVPDPSSAGNFITPPDLGSLPRLSAEVKDKLDRLPRDVDILLLHNDKMARILAGSAPVILFGHNHRQEVDTRKGSIMVNAGTSGAAGIRGLQALKIPYSVTLLHFSPGEGDKLELIAADSISVVNPLQGFSLERIMFNNVEQETEPG